MSDTDSLSEVEVWGLTENITDDFLVLYFENKRRSGGGPIKSVTRNGSVAFLTFCNICDAHGVLCRKEHQVHGAAVRVRRPPPWDARKVALCGLSADTSEAVLELYVENTSGREGFSIVRSADRTIVLVTFVEELTDAEFQHLAAHVEKRLLHHKSISVRRIRLSADILVENIGSQIPQDLLEMYFESRRSGGGPLQSVTMLRNNSAAIVSFCDWNVAQNVLRKSHFLQNCQLSVSAFYPDLQEPPTTGEPLKNEPWEIPGTNNMEHSSGQTLEVPTHDQEKTGIGEDLKVSGQEKTQSIIEVQMDEMQQVRPEVQQLTVQARTARSPDSDKEESLEPPPPNYLVLNDMEASRDAGKDTWVIQEVEVVMESAELRFIQEYYHELLAGMDAVTILPLDEDDKFGFKVAGDVSPCRTAVELLQHILSALSSRTITLDYPGVTHFLLDSEGKNALHHIEQQHHCIIQMVPRTAPGHTFTDPWKFVNDVITPELPSVQPLVTDERENLLLTADVESIKMFASLLESAESEGESSNVTVRDQDVQHRSSEEDLYSDESSRNEGAFVLKDDELDQVREMSLKEYQEQQLDEEAQLLLAIQRSMDTRLMSRTEDEDEEMQRVLEMSLRQSMAEDTEESLQRALELSLRDQQACPHRQTPPAETSGAPAQVRVLAADETGLVVACAALRKTVLAQLKVVSLEGVGDMPDISNIVVALERKHGVRVTTSGRQIQIQGFLHGPSMCQQELHQMLDTLQGRNQPQQPMMSLDIERDLDMVSIPEDSEEHNRVIQPFLKTLHNVKLTIDILQVQKVQNPLLYNQYQLKKQRMIMTDPNCPAERILYHGTSESSAQEICRHGFNRSFCGKNAVLYGQGVYFASVSELSTRDNYSPPNCEGKKFVLVARVLTGEFTEGKADMRTPPLMPNPAGDPLRRYDSLVNNTQKPTIFVIFNDTQAYPEYLITCRNRRDTAR